MRVRSAAESRAIPVRLPVPLVLGAIVTMATALHAALALRSPSPWIVPDELIYAEIAKSLGDGRLPSIRDAVSFGYGFGYPALLAPIWSVFDDVTKAYDVAKALNALILSLTAVPAYFLARRFVTEGYAAVVAGLSVAVPSMLYAGTLMTEVALYPVFVLALLAMAVALERPTVGTQGMALGAIGLACTIKMMAAVLIAAYISAIALYHWLDTHDGSRWRSRIRAYATTGLFLAAISLSSLVLMLVSGHRPRDVLGAYSVVLDHIDVAAVPWWVLLHVAELDLYLAVIPFTTTLLVVGQGLSRRAESRTRLFAVITVCVATPVIMVVAAYSSEPFAGAAGYSATEARLHERSTFVLAPLFFVGLMMWLRDRRGRQAAAAAVAVAAFLPAVIPIGEFDEHVRFQALALVPWVELADNVAWPLDVLALTLALAAMFTLAVRTRASAPFFLAPVLLVFAVVGLAAHTSMRLHSEWTRSVGVGATPTWIDAALPDDTSASVMWFEPGEERFVPLAPRHYVLWLGEFFNRRVDAVYELGSSMPYALPSTPVRLVAGRVVLEDGRPAPLGEFVLAPCYVRVAGVPIARDPTTGAVVYHAADPVRAWVADPSSCPRTRES